MLPKKQGLPEEGEILLCTVKKVLYHSVFVTIDEYENLEGMIHISEIAPGRIRNIRDYVKEGKKIVCKALRIRDRNIDLSLRRVSLGAKKKKNEDFKLEVKAENILKFVAEKLKQPDFTKKIKPALIKKYSSLHELFQQAIENPEVLKEIQLSKKELDLLTKTIKEKIKPPEVEISGTLTMISKKPDGIESIKKNLKKTIALAKKKKYDFQISYQGAPKYRLKLKAPDYKTAEKQLQEITDSTIKEAEKAHDSAEFSREKNE